MSDFTRANDRSALMKLPPTCLPVVLVVFALSIALDAINLIGFQIDPEDVGRFACSLRPFALVEPPNFWMNPLQLAETQCAEHTQSMTISIIFLAIKTTMAVFAFLILVGMVIWQPETFRKTRDQLYQRFQAPGGYEYELKEFVKNSLPILVGLMCLLLLMSISLDTRFDVKAKVLLEDGVIVMLPAASASIAAVGFVFASFAWLHKK